MIDQDLRHRAVFFDLDGTVLDDSGLPAAVRGACERVARASGAAPEQLMAANTAVWQELWPEVEEQWMLDAAVDAGGIGERAWAETLSRCGITDERLVRLAADTYRTLERQCLRPYPDVAGALRELHEAGFVVGLITNGASSLQRDKLDAAGLDTAFDPVVVSSEVGVKKPDPAIFEHALLAAQADPAASWHVGDNLWVDVAGADRAGLRSVWVTREGRPVPEGAPHPDLAVRSFTGLAATLLAQAPRQA